MSGMVAVANGIMSRVHSPEQCAGEHCWVHHPSRHPLADAPVWATSGRLVVYRACEHHEHEAGLTGLHPDPDDEAYRQRGATHHAWSWVRPATPHPCCESHCCLGPGAEPTAADRARATDVQAAYEATGAKGTDEIRAEILRDSVRHRLTEETP